jgi:hypothetical protein
MTAAEHVCGQCGTEYCPECVVFPFGVSRGAVCIACALELGGVQRQHSRNPKLSRREIRKRIAAQQAEAPAATSTSDELPLPEPIIWLDDANEGSELPGGWKQSYP